MEHSPQDGGYHSSEIKYEEYSEIQYRDIFTNLLHKYFDPYKQDALKHIRENYVKLTLKSDGIAFLGIKET